MVVSSLLLHLHIRLIHLRYILLLHMLLYLQPLLLQVLLDDYILLLCLFCLPVDLHLLLVLLYNFHSYPYIHLHLFLLWIFLVISQRFEHIVFQSRHHLAHLHSDNCYLLNHLCCFHFLCNLPCCLCLHLDDFLVVSLYLLLLHCLLYHMLHLSMLHLLIYLFLPFVVLILLYIEFQLFRNLIHLQMVVNLLLDFQLYLLYQMLFYFHLGHM